MSARRLSNPRTGEIRLVDEGPGAALSKAGIGGHVVQGLSADECRELARRMAHAERMRRWRAGHAQEGVA